MDSFDEKFNDTCDRVLIGIGELIAEKRHRKEEDQTVDVKMKDYILSWNTNKPFYLCVYNEYYNTLGMVALDHYHERSLAMAISGLIIAYEHAMEQNC